MPDDAPGGGASDTDRPDASAVVADLLSTVAPRLEGLAEGLSSGGAFCDVGTGVGWLAMRAARHWPEARIVGLDLDTRPLELARSNLAAEGMAERVELRQLDICTLSGEAFDLVWLPGPFLPRSIVPEAIACASRNLRAGGWIAFGTFGAPPDPVAQAMSDLRTVRAGGYPWSAAELGDLLTGAGLIDVSPVERTWQAPLELVVGRAP